MITERNREEVCKVIHVAQIIAFITNKVIIY